ncbi:MAG: hypothetical protein H0U98_12910 [Alphaproteobacteria bacterium]|nr:hypothetical protein [Alphaproteobacteria bacterium]
MRLALAGSLVLLAGAARAQDSVPPVGDEFVALFSSYCLQKFPDDGAVAALAAQDMLEPLSPAQVKTLDRKEGKGWIVSRSGVPYLLTVEETSLHSCALRRTSDTAMDGAPLIAAATKFVEAQHHKLLPPAVFARPMAGGAVSNSMTLQELDDKDIPLPQAYMFFVVSYPATARPDGTLAKPFYEIRFMRQMFRQQT